MRYGSLIDPSWNIHHRVARRLEALIRDRNALKKHVWRAEIVWLSADGLGTNEIRRRTGKSKTCVRRWQERVAEQGFEGLPRDKTRPPRIPRSEPKSPSASSL